MIRRPFHLQNILNYDDEVLIAITLHRPGTQFKMKSERLSTNANAITGHRRFRGQQGIHDTRVHWDNRRINGTGKSARATQHRHEVPAREPIPIAIDQPTGLVPDAPGRLAVNPDLQWLRAPERSRLPVVVVKGASP